MQVLVFNCGSSSVKYQLIDTDTAVKVLSGKFEVDPASDNAHRAALQQVIKALENHNVDAIGHRVVHGGE
ncbi:MAG: hypothetical protein AAF404_07125, partial [Pseudomonadota bacterium]